MKPKQQPQPTQPAAKSTVKCPSCGEQIDKDVAEAMDTLYRAYRYEGTRLADLILRSFKRGDEPEGEAQQRRVAIGAIEDWLDCKLSALVQAVSHFELDKDSMWCEHCEKRCDESEIKVFTTVKQEERRTPFGLQISEFEDLVYLCGECYATATASPKDEEGT